MDWRLILFPILGAAIGYGTNYLAVRMLFRPRKPIALPGLTLQGLIPRRRGEIAERVGKIVAEQLVDKEKIRAAIDNPAMLGTIRSEIEARVAEFLEVQFAKLPIMIRAVVPDELSEDIRKAVVNEILRTLPKIIERVADQVEDQVDVQTMVRERIEDLDLETLENMVLAIARQELRAIEVLGGVIGFVVGLLQAAATYFWLL